jgi:type I restriction enzyme R subunit
MKRRFIEEPANLKLLIVVSKLLTGFDAPSCTYIYLDNELRDHNLFQAICRTNRLDGDDKDYGHIVDYKELFGDVQDAIAVYTSDELDTESCGGRQQRGAEGLARGRQSSSTQPARRCTTCASRCRSRGRWSSSSTTSAVTRPARSAERHRAAAHFLLQGGGAFVRAYAELAQDLEEAGYSRCADHGDKANRRSSSTPRSAQRSRSTRARSWTSNPTRPTCATSSTPTSRPTRQPLGDLSSLSLTELIIQTGIHDAIARKLNEKGKLSSNAIAEGIINNVRKTIIRDQLTDPMFYEEMSKLLDDLIKQKHGRHRRPTSSSEEGRRAGKASWPEGQRRATRACSACTATKRRRCCTTTCRRMLAASVRREHGGRTRAGRRDEVRLKAWQLDNRPCAKQAPARLEGRPGQRGAGLERALPTHEA